MRLATLVLAALLATTALALAAPPADARQACTYGGGDPCDEYLVCVWNRVAGEWECAVHIGHCNPTYCDPYGP